MKQYKDTNIFATKDGKFYNQFGQELTPRKKDSKTLALYVRGRNAIINCSKILATLYIPNPHKTSRTKLIGEKNPLDINCIEWIKPVKFKKITYIQKKGYKVDEHGNAFDFDPYGLKNSKVSNPPTQLHESRQPKSLPS